MKLKKILLLLCFIGISGSSVGQISEEEAIKNVLERESATWRSGDIQGHADCWAIQPYSRIVVSAGDGRVLDISPDIMINPPKEMVGKGGTSVNSNYKIHISGSNAWVNHDEESTSIDGHTTHSYEFRMLEKIEGQWKLVGQSIHIRPQDER